MPIKTWSSKFQRLGVDAEKSDFSRLDRFGEGLFNGHLEVLLLVVGVLVDDDDHVGDELTQTIAERVSSRNFIKKPEWISTVFLVWIKYRGLCLKVMAKNWHHSLLISPFN